MLANPTLPVNAALLKNGLSVAGDIDENDIRAIVLEIDGRRRGLQTRDGDL